LPGYNRPWRALHRQYLGAIDEHVWSTGEDILLLSHLGLMRMFRKNDRLEESVL